MTGAQVRAFAGWPGTQTVFRLAGEGEREGKILEMRVTRTRLPPPQPCSTEQHPDNSSSTTGAVDVSSSEGIIVTCGNGSRLEVLELQPAGRSVMSAGAFKHGLKGRQMWVQQQYH